MTEPKQSDTPRTDERAPYVSIDFARELERENQRLKAELSSGLCSHHQEADPLNCSVCNLVKWLQGAIAGHIANKETAEKKRDQWRVVAIRLADDLRLEAPRYESLQEFDKLNTP